MKAARHVQLHQCNSHPRVVCQGLLGRSTGESLVARNSVNVRKYKRGNLFCGLSLHSWHHMGVLLHREGRGLVAKAFADDLDRDAGAERDRRVRVSQVVQPDLLQS